MSQQDFDNFKQRIKNWMAIGSLQADYWYFRLECLLFEKENATARGIRKFIENTEYTE